jgi:glycosyltransferase involved in cell wall biosynthesis
MQIYLKLPASKTHICPLGANELDISPREFSAIRLLYVGTFFNRHLDDTIRGFARYYIEYSGHLDIQYTLLGDSPDGEGQKLRKLVQELGLAHVIQFAGYVPRHKITRYYEQSNIGVSYVPIVPYYDCQPPTKTYEYLLAGMPVIATATSENRKIINRRNGILIQDTQTEFYRGLCEITEYLESFNSQEICKSVSGNSWHNIMINNKLPYIERIAHGE